MQIPEKICKCGNKLNGTRGVDTRDGPKEGDVSLCLKCGEVYFFTKDLDQREPTESEWVVIRNHSDFQTVRNTIQQIKRNIGH